VDSIGDGVLAEVYGVDGTGETFATGVNISRGLKLQEFVFVEESNRCTCASEDALRDADSFHRFDLNQDGDYRELNLLHSLKQRWR
jgi:Ca2+-binding EF-hand superfamily protein